MGWYARKGRHLMGIKVFWSEPTEMARSTLRRYSRYDRNDSLKCPGKYGYHNGEVVLGEVPLPHGVNGGGEDFDHSDSRWPKKCDHCDYVFEEADNWQHNINRIFFGGGRRFLLGEAPVGAMWDATWMPESAARGEDGICLVVVTPGGNWMVDGRASNCTKRDDTVHRCWVRHGDPRTGFIHVDKNGNTCGAGGGSIVMGSYHGFLHNGQFT